jgi:hypothetical protein
MSFPDIDPSLAKTAAWWWIQRGSVTQNTWQFPIFSRMGFDKDADDYRQFIISMLHREIRHIRTNRKDMTDRRMSIEAPLTYCHTTLLRDKTRCPSETIELTAKRAYEELWSEGCFDFVRWKEVKGSIKEVLRSGIWPSAALTEECRQYVIKMTSVWFSYDEDSYEKMKTARGILSLVDDGISAIDALGNYGVVPASWK